MDLIIDTCSPIFSCTCCRMFKQFEKTMPKEWKQLSLVSSEKIDYQQIVDALTSYHRSCPKCFRDMQNGSECGNCGYYYSECECTPLTPKEIMNRFDNQVIKNK